MYIVKKPNKYHNTTQVYNGRSYHSIAEANQAAELDLLLRARQIRSWEPQCRLSILIAYRGRTPVLKVAEGHKERMAAGEIFPICDYLVDFKVKHLDGTIEYLEVKGMELPEWKMKWKLVEAAMSKNPKIKLTVVKVYGNKKNNGLRWTRAGGNYSRAKH